MTKPNIAEMKVLVVDDHMLIRCELERQMKGMGCAHVEQASNVKEATDKMAVTPYNIIFLDWNMPGKSGYHLMQQCRQDNNYDGTAFVIVSAESEERYIIEALKAGATSYIVKPVAEGTLQEHVNKVIAWMERRAEKARQPA